MHEALREIGGAPLRRRFYAELGWVVLGLPLALLGALALLAGLVLGVALAPLFVGFLVLAGTLLGARRLGQFHRSLLRRLLGVRVREPPAPELRPGLWRWVSGRLRDPVGWRSAGYVLLRLPLAVLQVTVMAMVLLYCLGAATYPVNWFLLDGAGAPVFDIHTRSWPGSLLVALTGIAVLLAAPWVLRGLTWLDRLLARGLLGPVTLTARVRDLERTRDAVADDAAERLRRVERDLHDGAQARLVAVTMKLGLAKDEPDTGRMRELVAAAHAGATDALRELRELARGIRPPALDAGLHVALSTVAAHSELETSVRVDLPHRAAPAIETILYFSAAELLTNAAKHASARAAKVEVEEIGELIRLTVTDDGTGGARLVPGGGLAGLAERAGTVDGVLRVDSPAGGPTVVTVDIPIRR